MYVRYVGTLFSHMAMILTGLLCVHWVSASPLKIFYVRDTASMQVALTNDPSTNDFKRLGRVDGSCTVTTWAGTDPDGMSGYPTRHWYAAIICLHGVRMGW